MARQNRRNRAEEEEVVEIEIPAADPDLPQHQFVPFSDINEVPESFRRYRNARLTLKQINDIIEEAYDNQFEQHGSLVPDYGKARASFEASHHIEEGFWVMGPADEIEIEEEDR